jgi:hypothetical protein
LRRRPLNKPRPNKTRTKMSPKRLSMERKFLRGNQCKRRLPMSQRTSLQHMPRSSSHLQWERTSP